MRLLRREYDMSRGITNILIVGVGGQGTLLASRVIAEAAVETGNDVKVSEVHGMAQRGGSVVTQVRYGPKVYSPIIKKGDADIILAFEKLEAARYLDYLASGGLMVINNETIDPLPVMSGESKYPQQLEEKIAAKVPRTVVVDASGIAKDCGNIKAANVVLIGIAGRVLNLPEDALVRAIQKMVPERAIEINLRALAEGRNYLDKTAVNI
jgi:indolepyruvate ferredoxin oxidoreductase beta subunit